MPPNHIFNMFGRSPIRPLQQHMSKVQACAQHLLDFFAAVFDTDWEKAQKVQQEIADLEGQADHIKMDLRSHLPKGLFLPVPRGDVLQLLAMQDRIANKSKDIAGLILGRRMHFPQHLAVAYLEFLKRCLDCVSQAQQAINELDELLEAGFRGTEVDMVESMISKIAGIEHETDEMQIKIRYELFKIEETLSPINVMFLYEVFKLTGDIADKAEQVGHRLQLLLAR